MDPMNPVNPVNPVISRVLIVTKALGISPAIQWVIVKTMHEADLNDRRYIHACIRSIQALNKNGNDLGKYFICKRVFTYMHYHRPLVLYSRSQEIVESLRTFIMRWSRYCEVGHAKQLLEYVNGIHPTSTCTSGKAARDFQGYHQPDPVVYPGVPAVTAR